MLFPDIDAIARNSGVACIDDVQKWRHGCHLWRKCAGTWPFCIHLNIIKKILSYKQSSITFKFLSTGGDGETDEGLVDFRINAQDYWRHR